MISIRPGAARLFFALGVAALIPWFFMRVLIELVRSDGLEDYLRSVLVQPIHPWFIADWWWYSMFRWYDMTMLPGVLLLALGLSWRWTGGRLARWITGRKSSAPI